MKPSNKIWINGNILPIRKVSFLNFHQGLNYGACVYEGIRCYDTDRGQVIFRLREHLDRFFYSASVLRMKLGFTKTEVEAAIKKLIRVNKIKSGYIRPIAFYSEPKMGINILNAEVTFMILAWPWNNEQGLEPAKLYISKYRRLDPGSVDIKAKIGGYYANGLLGFIEAKEAGYDQPLFLDRRGFLTEGAVNNVFVVKGGVIYTPTKRNILGGITRNTVMALANSLKIKVVEKDIRPEILRNADEVFLTGTGIQLQPVGEVAKYFKTKDTFDIMSKINKRYKDVVNGNSPKFKKWLTKI